MNIITCYKIVPEEQDIVVLPDRNLSFDKAEWEIGQYDLNAVEAGTQLVEAVGGKLSALSVGGKQLESSLLRKTILSRGPQDLFMVTDAALDQADAHQTAAVLAAAVKKMQDYDLILCGEGSADLNAQQVGTQLGALLNIPVINAVSKITPQEGSVIVERTLENEVEVLEISLPVVITVTAAINLPRIPSIKNIMAAGKKPVTQWSLSDVGRADLKRSVEVLSTLAPEQVDRKQIIVEGETEESIGQFFDNIKKELL